MTKCAAPIDPNSIVIPKKPANKSASEHRKITKPIMEKRRRARINHSLEQLKLILLDQFSECSKKSNNLEKADILEMTVKYLKDLTAKQNYLKSQNNLVNHKNSIIIENNMINHQQKALGEKGIQLIQNGFKDCKQQINQCLSNVDKRLNERLNIHLNKFEKQKFDHGKFNYDQVLNLSIADHQILNQQVNNIILHTPSSACSSSSSTVFFPQSNCNGGSLSPGSERSLSPSNSEGPVWRPW